MIMCLKFFDRCINPEFNGRINVDISDVNINFKNDHF